MNWKSQDLQGTEDKRERRTTAPCWFPNICSTAVHRTPVPAAAGRANADRSAP